MQPFSDCIESKYLSESDRGSKLTQGNMCDDFTVTQDLVVAFECENEKNTHWLCPD